MGSKVGNNHPLQSRESLAFASEKVLKSSDDLGNYLVGQKNRDKREIDGVACGDVTYLSQQSKRHDWAAAAYRLSGRRKSDYEGARNYLRDLSASILSNQKKFNNNQVLFAQSIDRVLRRSKSKGCIKLDETLRRELNFFIADIKTEAQKSVEAVTNDCSRDGGNISHFLDDVERIKSGKNSELAHANVNKQGKANVQLLEQIILVNTSAKTLELQPQTVNRLKLKPRSFTAPATSPAGEVTGQNLLDKIAHWPGSNLQMKLAIAFDCANFDPKYGSEVFKTACKEVLLELAEQKYILRSLSDDLLNTIEDKNDRDQLRSLRASVEKLLVALDSSDSPLKRLEDLALAGYYWPEETAQTVVKQRRAFLLGPIPTDPAPLPVVNGQPVPVNGQLVPVSGQLPPVNGQQLPPVNEQQLPPVNGQQLPPINGQQLPPINGQQLPPVNGQQLPPVNGQQQPPVNAQPIPVHTQPAAGNGQPASNSTSASRPLPAIPANAPLSGQGQSASVNALGSQPVSGNLAQPVIAGTSASSGIVKKRVAQFSNSSPLRPTGSGPLSPPVNALSSGPMPPTNVVGGEENTPPPPEDMPPPPGIVQPVPGGAAASTLGGPNSSVNLSPVAGSVPPVGNVQSAAGSVQLPSNLAQPAASAVPAGQASLLAIPDGPPPLPWNQPPANVNAAVVAVPPPDMPPPPPDAAFNVTPASMPVPPHGAVVPPPGGWPGNAPPDDLPPPPVNVGQASQPPGDVPPPPPDGLIAPGNLPPPDSLPPPLPGRLLQEHKDQLSKINNLGVLQAIAEMNHKPRVIYTPQKPSEAGLKVANREDLDGRVGAFGAKIASKVAAAAKRVEKQLRIFGGDEAKQIHSKEFDRRLIENATRDSRMVSAWSDFEADRKENSVLVTERQEKIAMLHEQALRAPLPSPKKAVDEFFAADGKELQGNVTDHYFKRMADQFNSQMKGLSSKLPELPASSPSAKSDAIKLTNKITAAGRSAGIIELQVVRAFPDFKSETEKFVLQRPELGFLMPKGFTPNEVFSFVAGGLVVRNSLAVGNLFNRIGDEKSFRNAADEIVRTMERQFTLLRFLTLLLTDEEYVRLFPDEIRGSVREFGRSMQELAEDILDPAKPFRATYQLAQVAQIDPLQTMLNLNATVTPLPPADLPPPPSSDPAPQGGWIGGLPPPNMPAPALPSVPTTVN